MPILPIRVAIVEDDSPTREGLVMHLGRIADISLTAAYANGSEAIQKIPRDLPDVVLMDINMPGRNGIECVAALKSLHPQLQFLMLTVYDDSEQIFAALRAGASGYLLKRSSPQELVQAIKGVHEGGSPMSMQSLVKWCLISITSPGLPAMSKS